MAFFEARHCAKASTAGSDFAAPPVKIITRTAAIIIKTRTPIEIIVFFVLILFFATID